MTEDMKRPITLNRRHFTRLGFLFSAQGLWACQARAAQPKGTVLVLGDSLSAEYGLTRGSGWVALLQGRLDQKKPGFKVVNASVSGDTTSGGRSRLPALLKSHQPSVVVIELGGNDALRGLPLSMTRENLSEMVRLSRQSGALVLLLGMEMPPNYGTRYGNEFRQMYREVSLEHKVALLPFFLKGIADRSDPFALFQADRIHPNEKAQPLMLDNVWPELSRLLNKR